MVNAAFFVFAYGRYVLRWNDVHVILVMMAVIIFAMMFLEKIWPVVSWLVNCIFVRLTELVCWWCKQEKADGFPSAFFFRLSWILDQTITSSARPLNLPLLVSSALV